MNLEEKLAELEEALKITQDELGTWVRVNQELNQSAAEERAKLQGYGNGLGGVLLGSKYTATPNINAYFALSFHYPAPKPPLY